LPPCGIEDGLKVGELAGGVGVYVLDLAEFKKGHGLAVFVVGSIGDALQSLNGGIERLKKFCCGIAEKLVRFTAAAKKRITESGVGGDDLAVLVCDVDDALADSR
jgi:hypothetical protein